MDTKHLEKLILTVNNALTDYQENREKDLLLAKEKGRQEVWNKISLPCKMRIITGYCTQDQAIVWIPNANNCYEARTHLLCSYYGCPLLKGK